MDNLNIKLKKLYEEYWPEYSFKMLEIVNSNDFVEKPTNPLLINIDEKRYEDSDIKVMIFGQETNNWDDDFSGSVEHCLTMYDDFFNYDKGMGYGGQFWFGFNKFISLLEERFPNKKIDSVWNNTIKTGLSGRSKNYPPQYIYEIENKEFNIIRKEIEILQPDIMLFLCGPNYDNEIQNSLEMVDFKSVGDKFTTRQLSKLTTNVCDNVFRTYHPGYLMRKGYLKFFEEIIENVKL